MDPILALVIGTTLLSAKNQYEAGKQEQYNIDAQAEVEEVAAKSREAIRRENLNKVLAANIASASSAGMSGESLKSISLEGAKRSSTSEGAESLSDRLRQDILKRKGRTAKAVGNIQAASTLLTGAERSASLM